MNFHLRYYTWTIKLLTISIAVVLLFHLKQKCYFINNITYIIYFITYNQIK